VPLRWFSGGVLVSADPDSGAPLLLLGSDAFGRDRFSRPAIWLARDAGARRTRDALAPRLVRSWAALRVTPEAGSIRSSRAFRVRGRAPRRSTSTLALPRGDAAGAPGSTIFVLLLTIFALLGWPMVARGVRAIVLARA
jgi:hypothetical protein